MRIQKSIRVYTVVRRMDNAVLKVFNTAVSAHNYVRRIGSLDTLNVVEYRA